MFRCQRLPIRRDASSRFPEAFLGIEDFETGQSAFAVVVSGDPFGQMFGGNGSFAESDAQRIHFAGRS